MSASSKKKLRKEQNAAQLTERQRNEQKEAKKLKVASVIFVVLMAIVVVTALVVMVIKGVQGSGVLERNTIVATVGENEIDSVTANYYFADLATNTYSEWYNMYGDATASYMSLMGLDLSQPLDEQYYDEEQTWADYFLTEALEKAKTDYAIYDVAMAEGYTLSEEEQSTLNSSLENMKMYAMLYGYADVDDYVKAMYGTGSDFDSYEEYAERSAIASAYYTAYKDSLVYDDAALREYEKDNYNNYSSFSYASYYLSTSSFQADGEDQATAEAAAKEAAETLKAATNIDELDAAIATLDINADADDAASTKSENNQFTYIPSTYRDWLANAERKENDIEIFANTTTVDDVETVSGYYVVMFQSANDNTTPMANVRHLLVKHEHAEGEEHSEHDMEELKAEADGYLETWLAGDKTEESFIELVKEHSDDSSASTGGLFEDIHPGSAYVPSFLNWSIDPERKAGDAEVIESEYGYHVMYYVGDDELSYRDFLIKSDMVTADVDAWEQNILDNVQLTVLDTSRVKTDRILEPAA